MSTQGHKQREQQAIDAYYRLRTAQHYFKKPPEALDNEQSSWLQGAVERQQNIERQVLASTGAENIIVSDESLRRGMDEIQSQYDSSDAFLDDLNQIGMNVSLLTDLIERQQRVELIMDRQSPVEPVSTEQARRYYENHPDKFTQPEKRQAWHLLITVNPDYPENRRDKALQRISQILKDVTADASLFKACAERHSECPSALSGGELGWVPRGHLYPQIDASLFALEAGQVSDVIETDIGLHLVMCGGIRTAELLAFDAVVEQIRDKLTDVEKAKAQRQWLSTLK